MVKTSTLRAEIARYRLKQADLAADLGTTDDHLSRVLNERVDDPDLVASLWRLLQRWVASA